MCYIINDSWCFDVSPLCLSRPNGVVLSVNQPINPGYKHCLAAPYYTNVYMYTPKPVIGLYTPSNITSYHRPSVIITDISLVLVTDFHLRATTPFTK